MAKKKAVEPPPIDTETLVKELLAKREVSTPQEQLEIDKQLLNLTQN